MLTEKFKRCCEDAYADYQLYIELAKRGKDAGRRRMLEELSKAEKGRYLFSSKLAEGYVPKVSKAAIYRVIILRLQESLRGVCRIEDEEKHEKAFMNQIDERMVRYSIPL
jgi:hypothetical protein